MCALCVVSPKLMLITEYIQVLRRKLRLGSAIHYFGITSWIFTFSLSETKVSLCRKQMIETFFLRLIQLFVILYPVQHSNYCCRVSCSFICLFYFFHLVRILVLPVWTSVILSLFFVNFILFSPPLKIVSLSLFIPHVSSLYILSRYLQFFVLLHTAVFF